LSKVTTLVTVRSVVAEPKVSAWSVPRIKVWIATAAPLVRVALAVMVRSVVLVVRVPPPISKLEPRIRVVPVRSTVPEPVLVNVPFIARVPLRSRILAAAKTRFPVTVRVPLVARVPVS